MGLPSMAGLINSPTDMHFAGRPVGNEAQSPLISERARSAVAAAAAEITRETALTSTLHSKISARWPRASLRTYLVAITLVATVPLAVLSSSQMLLALQQRHESLAGDLQDAASSLATSVQQELAASIDALTLLSRSELLRRDDLNGFRESVLGKAPQHTGWSAVFVLDADGNMLIDSGDPTAGQGGRALAGIEPAAWNATLRAGKPLVSNSTQPAGAQRRTTTVAVPVMKGDKLRYVVGTGIDSAVWLSVLHAGAPKRDGGFAALVDGQRRVVADTLAPELSAGMPPPEIATKPSNERAAGVRRIALLDGRQAYTTGRTVGIDGWGVRVGVDAEPLDRREDHDVILTLGAAIGCLLLGVTLALLVARRVTEPLDQLAKGAPEAATMPVSVTEIAVLRDALTRADSQRRLALERLVKKAEEFETLFHSSPLALVFAHDAKCSRVLQNAAMDAIVPPDAWRLPADPWEGGTEVLHRGQAVAPKDRPLQRAAARGQPVDATELEVRANGMPPRFVLASAEPLWTDEGLSRGAIGAVVDITERKQREAERASMVAREKTARVEAETANRAKDEFLAMLGHELRNPLNAIATSVEVISRTEASAPVAVRAREIIVNQTRGLAHMMDRLLSVGRVIANDVELMCQPIDLAGLAQRAIAAARPKAAVKRHELRTDLAETWVLADAQRIGEVLEQLLDNAIRYTPPGGTIDVRLGTEGGRARLSIHDTGPGIDEALLPRLFEPFVQGKRSLDRRVGGLGIGLTMVKRLIELHGGSIDARSATEGSTFELQLPLLPRADRPPAAPARVPAAVARNVVVIDDNPDVLDGLRSMLELDGHAVLTAADGNAGLAMLARAQPDAAVIDIGLPGIDGYELARRTRAAGYGGMLIALSGYGQEGDMLRSLAAGFNAHMVKPVDAVELSRLLASCP